MEIRLLFSNMFHQIAFFVLFLNFKSALSHYRQLSANEVEILASWTEDNQQRMWELSGQYEGDIVLTHQRNGLVNNPRLRWPNREIPYEFSPEFTEQEKNFITNSLDMEYSKTCLKIRPRKPTDVDYVHITALNNGCMSYVGRIGRAQNMNLQKAGCLSRGTIAHEFMHAAGFLHQQSANDRDDYVDILWENIQPNARRFFRKAGMNEVSSFGQKYDYGSVMHYGKFAFSSNRKPTIVPKDATATIGNARGLSPIDIIKINKMYNCV